ncbi:unnamed protein product, partial [Rotaria sp. Silwood2]
SPFNQIPISIKIADYNLDGYPDMVTVMNESVSGTITSIVFLNQPCEADANSPCTYNRTFIPQTHEKFILKPSNSTLAAFFDILDNVK